MLMYCKKCGRVWMKFGTEKNDCDICGSICYPIPNKYLFKKIVKDKKSNYISW